MRILKEDENLKSSSRKALVEMRRKIRLLQDVAEDYADIELETGLIQPEINAINHVNEILHEALVFLNKETEQWDLDYQKKKEKIKRGY